MAKTTKDEPLILPVGLPPEEPQEDDEELDEEEAAAELWGLLATHSEAIEKHNSRIESMDKTLFRGLRGLVMILDFLEQATDPTASASEALKARAKVRDIIDMMQKSIK